VKWLCRIGLHAWQLVGSIGGVPCFVHECERCGVGRVQEFGATWRLTREQMQEQRAKGARSDG
jgi:hypothetical protein